MDNWFVDFWIHSKLFVCLFTYFIY